MKPLSSAKTAELVQKKRIGIMDCDVMDCDYGYAVDNQFMVVLKKLSKRDSRSKVKALQEFIALCKSKDADCTKSILPFWPCIYNKLTVEDDRRVREASQHALCALVTAVGREIAPYLHWLMASWMIALCDINSPVRSAAHYALEVAFPTQERQVEAMAFCKDSVIEHVHNILFEQTPQTFNDLNTTEKEDMESKYNKVLASNIRALRLLLVTLPLEKQKPIVPSLRDIVTTPKFWKLGKHKDANIRAAFYSVLSALCKVHNQLASEQAAKICPLVLHNLDETETVVGPALWEVVLHVVSMKECWNHVNHHKDMLPSLWSLLQQGGNGSASIIFPNLLPLLNKFPHHIIGEGLDFHKLFFNNLRAGLEIEKVATSSSESHGVTKAFFQCARYLITQNIDTNPTLCEYLVLEQVLPLVDASLTEPLLSQSVHPLYIDFLNHILHVDKDTSSQPIFNALWAEFADRCIGYLNSSNPQVVEQFDNLLMCFNTASISSYGQIKIFLLKMIKEAQKKINNVENPEDYLKLLAHLCNANSLMKTFTESEGSLEGFSKTVVLPMMKDWEESKGPSKCVNYIVSLYMAVYSNMDSTEKVSLLENTFQNITNTTLLYPLVDSVVSSAEQCPVVTKWLAGPIFGELMVGWVYDLCQLHLHNKYIRDKDNEGRHNGSSEQGSGDKRNKNNEDGDEGDGNTRGRDEEDRDHKGMVEASWGLLRIALNCKHDRNASVIGEKFFEQILSEIRNTLPSPSTVSTFSSHHIVSSVTLVCDVAMEFFNNLKAYNVPTLAEDLVLAMFAWSCYNNHSFSTHLLDKVESSWKMGVKTVIDKKGGNFNEDSLLMKAVLCLKDQMCNTNTMQKLQKLADLAIKFEKSVHEALDARNNSLPDDVKQMFSSQILLPFTHNCLPEWASGPMINKTMFLDKSPSLSQIHLNAIPNCMVPITFTSMLLVAMEPSKQEQKRKSVDESQCKEPVTEDQKNQRIDLILDIAYACALGKALLGRKGTTQSTELAKVTKCLETNFASLLGCMDRRTLHDLFIKALNHSLKEGHLWAHATALFLDQVKGHGIDLLNLSDGLDRFSSIDLPTVHTLNALLPYLPKEDIIKISHFHATRIQGKVVQQQVHTEGVRHLYIYNRCLEYVPPIHEQALSVFVAVCEWRQDKRNVDFFAVTCDVSELSWLTVNLNVECMSLMQLLVKHIPTHFNNKQWDFILCSLAAWAECIRESEGHVCENIAVQHFTKTVYGLLTTVSTCFSTTLLDYPASFPATIATDWKEFFCPIIYSVVFRTYVNLAACLPSLPYSSIDMLMCSMSAAAATTPLPQLLAHKLPPHLVFEDEDENLDVTVLTLLNHLTGLLFNKNYFIQIAAFKLLDRVMPEVSAANEKQMSEDGGETIRSPCRALMSAQDTCSHVLELVLQDTAIGECKVIEPNTQECTFATSYFLSWKLLLTLFTSASLELRAQYAKYLMSISAVDSLFVHLFRLMSEPSPQLAKDKTKKIIFGQQPELNTHSVPTSGLLQSLSCHVYYECLKSIPALMRHCWRSMDKKTGDFIDEFTTEYVSGALISDEIQTLTNCSDSIDNLTINIRPRSNEIVATYTVDEVSMALLLTLAPNHPLSSTDNSVESAKRIGVGLGRWRNWMLELSSCLDQGNIFEGLLQWKRSVDRHLQGAEECMICYSTIHPVTWDLARQKCWTCRNFFHGDCIFKWLHSSQDILCPYCRNPFHRS